MAVKDTAECEGGRHGWRCIIWKENPKRKGRMRGTEARGETGHLNFNPKVTEFTDICTRIRLAVPCSFSERTFALLSIPETYSSSYIRCRMRPFTVLRVEKEKRKHRKANWMRWIRAMPMWQFATPYVLTIPLVYCMHSYRRIKKGGRGKWHVTSDSFELSTCHLHHIQTSCQTFIFPLWWRWPRSYPADTPVHSRWTHGNTTVRPANTRDWQEWRQETGKKEKRDVYLDKRNQWGDI